MSAEDSLNPDTPVNPNSRSHLLKPLRGVPSESGFYGYSGKPLSNQDVANLKAKGVVFVAHPNGDLMPDGLRLKLPKYRSDFKRRGREENLRPKTRPRTMTNGAFEELFSVWLEEYARDEEPEKPTFIKWFTKKHPEVLMKELLRNAMLSGRGTQSAKALSTILEFGEAKPKQTVAVEESRTSDVEWDADKIIEYGLQLKGLGITAKDLEVLAEQRKV